ncbi:MAG: sn-glycerol-3-phosphate import ATP-binding protein UgpC [Betaproteobacteria bacterium]|nr:sn-glycerol-3-phosphate import ATP-binding protein UgpC [Betaproteobacteria bacterium]MDH5351262.1 sn-glycerol-3-phosphate import ATP-binding protein UgpC [Betaproteobacteria bacterium]
MAGVAIRDVHKSFGPVKVIQGISMDIADGEFVVMVGPSGCGKSTLLRMVAGLESITSGEIAIGERVVNELEPKDRDIAMVFQNYALYPHMSVYQNMAYGLRIQGRPKAEIEKRVQRAAEILELDKLLKRRPRELSGGQRQRVAMGRAIVREPKVFLFDEPLSNLDAKLRVQMRSELQALHQRLKTTTLYVTHDQVEAMTLAHRMMVMNAGRAEQIGAPLEVYQKPATTFVAAFIGSPPMNLIPGRIAQGGKVLAHDGEISVRLPEPRPALEGRDVLLGVRPEHFETCAQSEALLSPDIDFLELLGSDSLVYGHLGADKQGMRVAARLHISILAKEGRLPLRFSAEHVHLFDPESTRRIED